MLPSSSMEGPRDIDSMEFETRLLLKKLVELTGESEGDALHTALDERWRRLTGPATAAERKQHVLNMLETSLWRYAPKEQLGRSISRADEDAILGYGPEGA